MQDISIRPIARMKSDFPTKFGIPRQAGLVEELRSTIIFEPEYRNPDALRGMEDFTHLWLIWQFSEAVREDWSPTVRPPRLGGNKRMGVFATRSPYRPNPIGLSSVSLIRIEHTPTEGDVLVVGGADLLDGTPIYDIKPYLAFTDSHPDAKGGFADEVRDYSLSVEISEELLSRVAESKRRALVTVLEGDPRPSYKPDGDHVYGMRYADYEVSFTVSDGILTVTDIRIV